MSVCPLELQRVLSDEFNASKLEIIRNMNGKQNTRAGDFVSARSTRTLPSQDRGREMRLVSVRPDDHQFTGMYFLDLCRCRHSRIDCHSSTSRTGASNARILT